MRWVSVTQLFVEGAGEAEEGRLCEPRISAMGAMSMVCASENMDGNDWGKTCNSIRERGECCWRRLALE